MASLIRFLLLISVLSPFVMAEDPALLTIDRIYQSDDFNGRSFAGRWLENAEGSAFTMVEAGGIVRVDAESGEKSVMVSQRELT
ncbi:MAG: hypothetical protein P1U77_21285, partial [Rubripirellula sp.]|nr:hypothetical protein [Rubripirellula sp.]